MPAATAAASSSSSSSSSSILRVSVVALVVTGTAAVCVLTLIASTQKKRPQSRKRREGKKNEFEKVVAEKKKKNDDDGNANANANNVNNSGGSSSSSSSEHDIIPLPPHIEREIFKSRRRQEKLKELCMKTPMYDNVKMQDPNGELLNTISLKKGNWYVKKGLADWIQQEDGDGSATTTTTTTTSGIIRLRFEPRGRSSERETRQYEVSQKQNRCVTCGAEEHYTRHYIVPYCYRSLFPLRYKCHQSHDVVILCHKCRLVCERAYQERQNQLEDHYRRRTFGASLYASTTDPFETNYHLYHVRSCALALLNWKHKLPQVKADDYETQVRKYYDLKQQQSSQPEHAKEEERSPEDIEGESHAQEKEQQQQQLTREQLQSVIDGIQYRRENPNYVPGPELVATTLQKQGHEAMESFIRDWRRFFLTTMQPRFLPVGWSVDRPVTNES